LETPTRSSHVGRLERIPQRTVSGGLADTLAYLIPPDTFALYPNG
jgi:hypothetical protein